MHLIHGEGAVPRTPAVCYWVTTAWATHQALSHHVQMCKHKGQILSPMKRNQSYNCPAWLCIILDQELYQTCLSWIKPRTDFSIDQGGVTSPLPCPLQTTGRPESTLVHFDGGINGKYRWHTPEVAAHSPLQSPDTRPLTLMQVPRTREAPRSFAYLWLSSQHAVPAMCIMGSAHCSPYCTPLTKGGRPCLASACASAH